MNEFFIAGSIIALALAVMGVCSYHAGKRKGAATALAEVFRQNVRLDRMPLEMDPEDETNFSTIRPNAVAGKTRAGVSCAVREESVSAGPSCKPEPAPDGSAKAASGKSPFTMTDRFPNGFDRMEDEKAALREQIKRTL